ncbi:MAG: hypothetical protein M3R54_00945 [Chloroflexota bacterium]|nr:hypothetical protein [Chloroflexota bacterium]
MVAACEASVWCVSIVSGLATNVIWGAAQWYVQNINYIGQAQICAYAHSSCGLF